MKRFMPLKPWHGGPPHSISTSPFCGSFWPSELVFSPDMTSFSRTLQSSVKTVVPGLFSRKAWAAGSHISMAQSVSDTPGETKRRSWSLCGGAERRLAPPDPARAQHNRQRGGTERPAPLPASARAPPLTCLVEALGQPSAAGEDIQGAQLGELQLGRLLLAAHRRLPFAFACKQSLAHIKRQSHFLLRVLTRQILLPPSSTAVTTPASSTFLPLNCFTAAARIRPCHLEGKPLVLPPCAIPCVGSRSGRFSFPSTLPWGGPIWSPVSSAGLPSSRKMRSYWRESSAGLRG